MGRHHIQAAAALLNHGAELALLLPLPPLPPPLLLLRVRVAAINHLSLLFEGEACPPLFSHRLCAIKHKLLVAQHVSMIIL